MVARSLPAYSTPFIGRTEELRQIEALLSDTSCRLLTLIGPGGIGKTRLAVEIARLMMDDEARMHGGTPRQSPLFSDGACLVPLQPLTSPDVIVPAIADALHLTFYGEQDPKQQLLGYLRGKHLLFVLDNFEHLTEGATLLPELLEHAPHLKLLVTSRERLRLREEWLVDVDGLTFPETTPSAPLENYTAVQLFLRSAQREGFSPAKGDSASIVRICQVVEGIPLAVELAAAWVRVMPCAEIAREVERNLDILTTTLRNVPEKHRSMRAAFERSWELLTAEEQAVFRKLSVFRGGSTREGAEQVAGATRPILASLVDKSLVQAGASGRYSLHELLRQYAEDKLVDAGEEQATIQRHGDYYLWLAEMAEAYSFGREQVAWFDRLEAELDNLRVALNRWTGNEMGLRLATALGWFVSERGHWNEGQEWLERVLAANPAMSGPLRAKALYSAGALAARRGDQVRGQEYCRQALALARAANDRKSIAWSLSHMAIYRPIVPDECLPLLEESLALFRELGDPMGVSHTLIRLSWCAIDVPDYSQARRLLEEAAAHAHEAGDRVTSAWVQYSLGELSWFQDHDLKQARTYIENSLTLFQEAHFPHVNQSFMLADIERGMGNLLRAQRLYEDVLIAWSERAHDHPAIYHVLAGLAGIARTRDKFERAATLLGSVDSILRRVPETDTNENITFYKDVTAAREQLGEMAFAEAWAAGKAMTREQAIAYALEDRNIPADVETTAPAVSQSQPLNARELEVLSLVATGLSNREIAVKLFVTVNTVKWYLKGIFGKLHVANRAQAVARAQTLGLLARGSSRVDSG